ncbi:hypothetical protein LRAMOSA09626 [Lichtheimia ramosa]|uniref:Grh/CP2 DB domain-containing protein n=1 Tax=Lichtheimia ramosa TaxID=688394 RepID=A0A077WJ85_9FUNG|nr:hypothetical protein LRAMOSA09626 [Lichtheimia ramosa]
MPNMIANTYIPCLNSTSQGPPTDNFRHNGSSLPVSPTSEHHVNAITLPSPPLAHPSGSFPTPPPAPSHQSCFRYDIVLQAPPSVAQRETFQLTYLNKSQYYCIRLYDTEGYDGPLTSTLTLTFHEETHRRLAANYWRFWASQQKNPTMTRALDPNPSRSKGIHCIQYPDFDRIVFEWNGKQGATLYVRFNCLSTDFSRIKGVKGIPLRLHMETTNSQRVESTFCRIKLFRDKGAERKNKDDMRYIERQMERMREKGNDPHALWLEYWKAVHQPYTVFSEAAEPLVHSPAACHQQQQQLSHDNNRRMDRHSDLLQDETMFRSTSNTNRPYESRLIRHQPTRLAIYARMVSSDLYHGIYLDEFTVHELVRKVCAKMLPISSPIRDVIRYVPGKDIAVQMDDCMIRDLQDEQDMKIEYKLHSDGSAILILHY